MRSLGIPRLFFQRFLKTLTVTAAVALLVLFASTIIEPTWAAGSHSMGAPSAYTASAANPGSRNSVASKPVPAAGLPDVPRQQTSAQVSPARNLSAANQLQHQGPVFIENRGQFDSRVKFLVTGNGANLWLTNDGIVFDFQRPTGKQSPDATEETRESSKPFSRGRESFDPRSKSDQPAMERLVFKQKLVRSNPNPTIEARDPQSGIYNYFVGADPDKRRTHVLAYREVVYRDIWKGIDLKLFANGQNLEQEFIVHPGSDSSAIRIAYDGIQNLDLVKNGSLKVRTGFGTVTDTKPIVYQDIDGKRMPVAGGFRLYGKRSYGFALSAHRADLLLVIDPSLLYSTYLGGTAGFDCGDGGCGVEEVANGIAVDSSGSAYVTGQTGYNFPTTTGAYLTTDPGGICAFVTKFTPLGDHLQYSTYLCNVNTAGGQESP